MSSEPWKKYQDEDWKPEVEPGPWDNYQTEEPVPDDSTTTEPETPVSTFQRVSKSIVESAPFAFFSGLGQSALGNFADEIGAAGTTLIDIATSDEFELDDYSALYDYNKGQYQDHYDEVDSASPIASAAGELTGYVAGVPGAASAKFISKAGSLPGAIGRGTIAGAGEGAVMAAGEADENIGEAVVDGGLWGAAGGAGGGLFGAALEPLAKRAWRGLANSQKKIAEKKIREQAVEYGVDVDEVIKMYRDNPDMTLADIEVAFKDLARGAAQRNPQAMQAARETLTERNAGAPERIGAALEEASGVSRGRADEIAGQAQAARRELGPEYEQINEANVPFTKIDAGVATPHMPIDIPNSPARQIIDLMPEEYNAALINYRRKIGDPSFDPEKAGYIPGAMIQDMKVAANKTQNSPTASGAAQQGAKAVNQRLLETADEYIPGYGPLREQYGQRVLAPEEGLDLAGGYMNGGWERLEETLEQAAKLRPEAKEAFEAGVVKAADRAVRDAPGAKGTQFYGAPLLRNETAGQRLGEVIPDAKRGVFDDALESERTMHTTMSEVTGVGSPTAQNQASAGRLGGDGLMGAVKGVADKFIERLSSAESQKEMMKILLESNMDEKALRELLSSPHVPGSVRDRISKLLGEGAEAGVSAGSAAGAGLLSSSMQ